MKCVGLHVRRDHLAALAETFVTITISRNGITTGRAVKGNLPGSAVPAGCACIAFVLAQAAPAQRLPLERIKLPPGFEIGVFADVVPVASGLRSPNGVALRDGALYVAEVNRILRFDDIEAQLDARPKPAVVTDRYPGETHHGLKFIRFGPDGRLYVPVGAPCNTCEPDPRHGLISRIRPDGSDYEVFARGVRNSVGFDWDPRTRELWFTDNGSDMLGDDLPSDELNHAPRRSEEHTSELQSPCNLVCRLLLE